MLPYGSLIIVYLQGSWRRTIYIKESEPLEDRRARKPLHVEVYIALLLTFRAPHQIFLSGLALQLASFFLFVVVVLRFLLRVATLEHHTWCMDAHKPWHEDWRMLSYVLIISSIGIMVSEHWCFHSTTITKILMYLRFVAYIV